MKQSKLLKKLLTASERSFIVIDRTFAITDTSCGAERFSESPNETLLHKDIRHVFPETIGLEETFNNIWFNQATSFEIKGICRSSKNKKNLYFDFYIIGTNELDEDDKSIIICIEDVTEMMMTSQVLLQRINESELLANALMKSKEYIDKIISAMADALIVTDRQGVIKTINPATVNLFGYSQPELIGKSIAILFCNTQQFDLINQNFLNTEIDNSQDDSQHLGSRHTDGDRDDFDRIERNFQNIEILCLAKTQEEILISFSCSTISDYQFEYNLEPNHHFVYVGRNITDIKRKENELLAARQFAEQSAQAKSIFLANMSHEIRTPINGVLGMTELLMGTPLSDRQQDFVDNIRLSGNLLLSLINRILDLSKLEDGRLELENLSFDLEECIEETLEIFALQAHGKALELNSSLENGLPNLLLGDAFRLRQILMNLIGNAIKFTDKGEVLIKVERDRLFEQNLSASSIDLDFDVNGLPQVPIYLRFSIIDTGIGIDEKDFDKLFKSFSQVDATTTRRFGGTGLGLAICHQLVNLMHGEIGICSPVEGGSGTCFWFRVPFYLQSQKASLSESNGIQHLNKKFILVIDNNKNSCNTVAYHLKKFGAEVYIATNIVEAIAYLDTGKQIDAALIDWQLTGFDSKELIQQIHTKQNFANLPFVAMLTADRQGEIEIMINQGFRGYVTKPLKGKRLLKTMLLALGIDGSSSISVWSSSGDNVKEIKEDFAEKSLNPLSNAKILLAEDNIVNQKVMMSYLSQLNCQADLAENGEEVLKLLKIKDYDMILMDCQMPFLDGYDTTQTIRKLEATTQSSKHIVIVAMTANAFKEDRDRCLAIGMDDYLSKPIRRSELKEVLENWMLKIYQKQSISSVSSKV